jgi:hypothetical protein
MFKLKSHVAVALVGITAMVVLAGGMAVASNTGFKINKSLPPALPAPGNPNAGNSFLSIPYFNPYGNFGSFCTQTGLISIGINRATGQWVNPTTGVTSAPVTCGSAGANALTIGFLPTSALTPFAAGLSIRVRNTPLSVAGTPTSIIIVGSHNPSLSVTVPKSGVGFGDFWFMIPYHTTAVTANDLCLSSGFTSSGLSRATVARLDPTTGVTSAPVNCGSAGAIAFNLTLGEGIKFREPNGPLTFVPAHF